MKIEITIYPAKNGDSFLVSYGTQPKKHLLIDGGYVDTFVKYLKKDLIEIGRKGESLEKLIVTHIDGDHISGIKKLLGENKKQPFIQIKEVWHNTFRHLFEPGEASPEKKDVRIIDQIIRRGLPPLEDDDAAHTITAEQGTAVGALLLEGKYAWNTDFGQQAVSVESKAEIMIDENVKIKLLSPDAAKLNALKEYWKDELRKYGLEIQGSNDARFDDAFELLMMWEKAMPLKKPAKISGGEQSIEELLNRPFDEDTTATNGSSIAFVLYIQDKKLLWLADAHPDLAIKSLKKYFSEDIVVFDLIKVAHHGSFNNINKELLERIDGHKYIISTNGGRYGHPDKETIAHIVCRPARFTRHLYFNYETEASRFFNHEELKKKYNYSIHYLNQPSYLLEL